MEKTVNLLSMHSEPQEIKGKTNKFTAVDCPTNLSANEQQVYDIEQFTNAEKTNYTDYQLFKILER